MYNYRYDKNFNKSTHFLAERSGCCGKQTNVYVFVIGNQTMVPSGLVPQQIMNQIPGQIYIWQVVMLFLSVAKDFAKRWADMALLYNMASHRSTGGFNYFVGGNHHPAKRNR